MALVEFELPEELQSGTSAREILQKILDRMPDTYDKTEGGFLWDMAMPLALEVAELIEFWTPLNLKNAFHMWAAGRWLDYHAHDCGLSRHAATYAYGDVEVTTTESVTFPQGFVFSVPSENDVPAIDFETVEEVAVDGAQTVTIRVKAVEAGTYYNVKRDSITIMKNPIRGVDIENITNPAALTGGTEAEDDESLRQRIDDFYAGRGASFVGNKKDYERWSKEVDGVGYAHCIPLYAGANSVKIVIADSNGDGAVQEILNAVEQHIFGTGHDDIERLAPIGVAQWAVVAPTPIPINISANFKLADGFSVEVVTDLIETSLRKLFKSLADDENYFGELRYIEISKALLETLGVADFKHLRVNGSLENVLFAEDEMPAVGEITILDY